MKLIRPTGIVTFLFTDIEGSTKLAQEFPKTLQGALEKHHSIIQQSVESNNGFVFEIVGDAFCCAFENASDAVKAAVDAQLNLANEKWDEAIIKVRMGIHSGNAEWSGERYMGYITLARSARIMSAAFGEQIITSNNTYDLTRDKFDAVKEKNISFRDLGERRLKDVIQPIKLFQIVSPGLREDFPPLKTLDARPNNLPVQLTSFIGREKEMSDVKKLLSDTRLLTLLGPGGTGKTRLSMQVAAEIIDDFADGVFIVELAPVSDPSLITQTLMNALRVSEVKGQSQDITLIDYLKDKEILITLDNCEHLVTEAANLAERLLSKCQKLKIIATSREALNCSGEKTYVVPTLLLPDPKINNSPEQLSQYEAVRLFIERALVINQKFRVTNENAPALANICCQLDGIPLAIELAAARINILTLEGINKKLNDRFKLLTGGRRTALPRQQTLKALVDWSYDLLSEKEKLLLQCLTVFSGGCTLEASEKICSYGILEEDEILDLLENLTNKSLVKVIEKDNNFRYTMLETIKKYGDEKLIESGKKDELQENHFNYFYKLAEDSETELTGTGQREWIKKIAAENENIRDSLKWSLINNPGYSLKMSVVLGKFWELRSHFTEGLEVLRKSLEGSHTVDLMWKAKAIYWTGFFLIHQGMYSESKKYLNQCLDIFREINYKDGEALTLMSLGTIALFEGDYTNLNLFSGKSLSIANEINNRSYIARNLQNIALGLMQQGEHDAARNKFEEGLCVYRELNDSVQLAKIIGNIGVLEFLLRNYEKARIAYEESLQLRYELGDRQGISIALSNLGSVALEQKDLGEAERLIKESLEIMKELGDKRVYVTTNTNLGYIAFYRKDFPKAVKLFRESIIIANELGDTYSLAKGIEGIANTLIEWKMFDEACLMAAKYISLLKSSNKNLIDEELLRIDEIKDILKSKLNDADFEKNWVEGETMTIEEALDFVSSFVNNK